MIMNVQELIDLLEDCDPEAFGSRTCRAAVGLRAARRGRAR